MPSRILYLGAVYKEAPEQVGRTANSDWKEQKVRVYGKDYLFGQVDGGKLYHGSPTKLEIGTVLVGGRDKNYKESSGAVSITSVPGRAYFWGSKNNTQPAYVYEVEPIGEIVPWRVSSTNYGESFNLWEGRVEKARIIGIM